ncbi:Crp/Fnr family transcriptional regulator [uncultured Holdemanella sp.]|uniref:Crp/Fnr family transcriptional regulator n=1 Tax=uncultured Holdemanella sp. TaxID=1763549 RepID=UPI0025839D7F|nr:Crp/Fnr family transcriptional regulator [uncultured Holdemanella sp.]
MSEFVLDFFEGKNLATIEKKKHSYLMIDGHDQEDIYILKDGIVKTSIILSDGREFNIMYLKGFDILSLLKDEVKKVTSASFHIRIESGTAVFYRVNRKLFSKFLSENEALRDYVDTYYRKRLSESIYRQQLMTMNGKNGAVCAFIYYLVGLFGRKVKKGIFIDLQVTNDDIAGFCGVSTRNSVNRILRGLRQQGVITMVYHKILVLDVDYLKRYV